MKMNVDNLGTMNDNTTLPHLLLPHHTPGTSVCVTTPPTLGLASPPPPPTELVKNVEECLPEFETEEDWEELVDVTMSKLETDNNTMGEDNHVEDDLEEDDRKRSLKDDTLQQQTRRQEDVPDIQEPPHQPPPTTPLCQEDRVTQEETPDIENASINPRGVDLAAGLTTAVSSAGPETNQLQQEIPFGDIRRYVIYGRPHLPSMCHDDTKRSKARSSTGRAMGLKDNKNPGQMMPDSPAPSVVRNDDRHTDKSDLSIFTNHVTLATTAPGAPADRSDDTPPPPGNPPEHSCLGEYSTPPEQRLPSKQCQKISRSTR